MSFNDIPHVTILSKITSIILRKVIDFQRRLTRAFGKPAIQHTKHPMQGKNQAELARQWNQASMKYLLANLPPGECRQRTNAELGLPSDYSPGQNR